MIVDPKDGTLFTHNLADFFVENLNLASLSITGIEVTDNLCTMIVRMQHSLKYLDLSNVGMLDDSCMILASTLRSCHLGLRSLELNGNSIGTAGCLCLSGRLLRNPNCKLVRLYLDKNRINDEGARALALGLNDNETWTRSNENLKTLSLLDNRGITAMGYRSFLTSVWMGRSLDVEIDSLSSNHTIQRIILDDDIQVSDVFKTKMQLYLHLNLLKNKRFVVNQKFIMHNLVFNQTCNMGLFETIPSSLIPSVFAMIANHATHNDKRTDAEAKDHRECVMNNYKYRHLALHHLIRLCPSVCERHDSGSHDSQLRPREGEQNGGSSGSPSKKARTDD